MTLISDIPDEPKYSIKTVCNQTGIRPVTLRAWERRYEVLTPQRSENRYRMYSERDIAVLRWIKSRLDQGVSISSAVNELHSMQKNGIWPEAIAIAPSVAATEIKIPPADYAARLYKALIKHDEGTASELMHEIQNSFDVKKICTEILIPCLIDIGEAWYHNKIRVTTEHFASAFIRGRLMTMMQSLPTRRNAPHILIGCAPTEQHEIGSLMLAVLLRSKGYRVEFLGPDIPLEDLVDYASFERPDMIILSATMQDAALELSTMQEKLSKLRQAPIFGYGGAAFQHNPALRQKIKGVYLGGTLDEALINIATLFSRKNKSAAG